jgi:hypothetical protein
VRKIGSLTLLLGFIVLLLASCGQGDTQDQPRQTANSGESTPPTEDILYENKELGLRVYQAPEWELDQEGESETFNVAFQRDKLKALITFVSPELPLDKIKQELITGSEPVQVLEESDTYLALQSKRKEPIRTDIYIEQTDQYTIIYTFKTPAHLYPTNKPHMDMFKAHVHVF